jgi:hypothetical protein
MNKGTATLLLWFANVHQFAEWPRFHIKAALQHLNDQGSAHYLIPFQLS